MKKELLVTGAGREATITVDRAADGTWLVTVDGSALRLSVTTRSF